MKIRVLPAGAQAVSSLDTFLAPFIRKDGLTYKQVRQSIQQFIFSLNISTRWGQSPFTNVTLDWKVPEDFKDQPVIIGGEFQEEVYGDFQPEMDMMNRAFLEVMRDGDALGRVFTFPIPTYNITKNFNWDAGEDSNEALLFEVTGKYGIPYFQNFINSSLKPSDVRSLCCRLQLDLRELKNKTGGLFGAGEKTGSIGVVTLNLPRLGYLSKSKEEFYKRLADLMDLAKESLELKRKVVQTNYDRGLMPYTKHYLETLDHHFTTIGLVGMNECCLNFFGKDLMTQEGQDFASDVLMFMRDRIKGYQEETGHIYNLEASPAESTAYRLAKADKLRYPDIITAGKETCYYTNSSQLPVGATDDLFKALSLQDNLQSLYTGGTVFHVFLGESMPDWRSVKELVKAIAYTCHMPYFSITPTFSICPEHGYIPGDHETCPLCKEKNE